MTGSWRRGGFTLLELMVAMAIMAVGFAVAGVAMTRTVAEPSETEVWAERLEQARRKAVSTGRPVVVVPDSAHHDGSVLLLPDGRAVGPRVDALTGRWEGGR